MGKQKKNDTQSIEYDNQILQNCKQHTNNAQPNHDEWHPPNNEPRATINARSTSVKTQRTTNDAHTTHNTNIIHQQTNNTTHNTQRPTTNARTNKQHTLQPTSDKQRATNNEQTHDNQHATNYTHHTHKNMNE